MLQLFYPYIRLLFIEIALFMMAGVVGSLCNVGLEDWYHKLQHPSLMPPDAIFGPVWTILYILIGYAFWRVWERRLKLPRALPILALFGAQMVLNWGMVPVFFVGHDLLAGVVVRVTLVVALVALIFVLWGVERLTAKVLIPYALWCLFDTYLAWAMWTLNNV